MALTDFFRINLPYGMKKNQNNEWYFFNREYLPLGWNDKSSNIKNDDFSDLPIHTSYKGLTEKFLISISYNGEESVRRNEKGEIYQLWFYNDKTNPQSTEKYWPEYFEKIKQLSKREIKQLVM